LENPSYGTNYIQQAIKADQIKVEEIEGIDPNENRQTDAYVSKAYIQEGDNWRELTDDEYDYINDNEFDFIDTVVQSELPWGREDQEMPVPLDAPGMPLGPPKIPGVPEPGAPGGPVKPLPPLPANTPHQPRPTTDLDVELPTGPEYDLPTGSEGAYDPSEPYTGPDTPETQKPLSFWDKMHQQYPEHSPEEHKRRAISAGKVAGGIAGAGALAGGLVGHAIGKRKKKDDDDDEDEDAETSAHKPSPGGITSPSRSADAARSASRMKQHAKHGQQGAEAGRTSYQRGQEAAATRATQAAAKKARDAMSALARKEGFPDPSSKTIPTKLPKKQESPKKQDWTRAGIGAGAGIAAGALGGSLVGRALSKRKKKDDDEKEEDFEDAYYGDEEGELSDDWMQPNYRGDQHDFQPGEIVEVGPWGPNDEADHLEVVLQIRGDVVNTIPITDDAYGAQYGGRGGLDIELIRPQSDSYFDDSDFKPADGREY